ncbi:MAG: peptidase M23 [Flavobacteriia bacterium]|nr:MAG: peptidase M23 [Flavobacteriia bacterium]
MGKVKYHYDPETLSFQKIRRSKKRLWFSTLVIVGAVVLNLFLGFFLLSYIFESPKEKELLREVDNLKLNYKLLAKKETQHAERLSELETRDNKIYRQYFEAKPISEEVRKAGYGGVNRYKGLEGFDNSKLIMDLTKQMDELSKRIVIQSKSLDDIVKMAENKEDMLASLPAISPVRKEQMISLASGFGMRMHPLLKIVRPHNGIDLVGKHGTPIYATGNGTVTKAESSRSFGKVVYVDHGYGYETIYAHMSRFGVRKGQKVKRGDVVGYMGNTGLSKGTHLHYEVHKDGRPVNPTNFFYGDLTPEEFLAIQKVAEEGGQPLD